MWMADSTEFSSSSLCKQCHESCMLVNSCLTRLSRLSASSRMSCMMARISKSSSWDGTGPVQHTSHSSEQYKQVTHQWIWRSWALTQCWSDPSFSPSHINQSINLSITSCCYCTSGVDVTTECIKTLQVPNDWQANAMVALPNIGGALCSTLQSLADAHYLTAVQ